MSKKIVVIVLAIGFVLLLGCAYVLYQELGQQLAADQLILSTQPTAPSSTPSDPNVTAPTETLPLAPDFVIYDEDGKEVRLSDFFGKPIVLNFWASWCGPCKMEMPDFNEKHLQMGEEIHFLMINMTDGYRETVDIASTFIQAQGYTFPVYYDTAGNASMTYGVYSLPTTFFIDAEGHAIAQAVGAIDAETLQRGIDMIVNKQ
jgi:thiol-disulfide isomerase/thioredoxin